ncbi:hypothetical protein ACRAWD_21185 [Caulobacter segnis]
MARCTGDWILELDADEGVTPAFAQEVRETIEGADAGDWYQIPVDNYVGDQLVRHGWGGSLGTSSVARLYRHGHKSWKAERVHPGAKLEGRFGGRLTQPIQHMVDEDIADMFARLGRYTALRAQDLADSGKIKGVADDAFRGVRRFFKCYGLAQGLEGRRAGLSHFADVRPLSDPVEPAGPRDPAQPRQGQRRRASGRGAAARAPAPRRGRPVGSPMSARPPLVFQLALGPELRLWAKAGHAPVLWWRDDDARGPTGPLERLLSLARRRHAPLTLAAIAGPHLTDLVRRIETEPGVEIAVHGFKHVNRQPEGRGFGEIVEGDGVDWVRAQLRATVVAFHRAGAAPTLFVPPWNNLQPRLIEALPDLAPAGGLRDSTTTPPSSTASRAWTRIWTCCAGRTAPASAEPGSSCRGCGGC